MFEARLINIFEMRQGEVLRFFPDYFQATAVKHETCRVIGDGWKIGSQGKLDQELKCGRYS
jgi:hypothetical protein